MPTDVELGSALVDALAAQDWGRVAALFAPGAPFRALIPKGLREGDAAERLRAWFGDADPLELVDSEIEPLADRLHVRYRFRAFEEGRWHLVEQQLYCDVEGGRIGAVELLCSGFREL
jgi:hypothetical protein